MLRSLSFRNGDSTVHIVDGKLSHCPNYPKSKGLGFRVVIPATMQDFLIHRTDRDLDGD